MCCGDTGGGGGGNIQQTPSSSTVSQTNLPTYAEPFVTRLMERGEEQSNAPYQGFEGERISGFGADTTQGFQDIRNISGSDTPAALNQAGTTLTNIATTDPLQQQAAYGEGSRFSDSGIAQQYMDPYVENVLDAQNRRLDQRFNEQQLGREAQAVQQGAFSNSRRGVQEGIAERELNLQRNELEAKALSDAFRTGSNIFAQDEGRLQAGQKLDADIFAGNQQRSLEQGRLQMGAAEQLQTQAAAQDELAYNRAKNLAGVGGALDAQAQQELDLDYTDFLNQRDFPAQQLNYYSGILRGVPIAPSQETTTFQAPPNQLSQLLGLGVGGLGLAKALS